LALRRLPIDVGLLPLCARPHALAPFLYAPQSLAFPPRGSALAFVRSLLAFVGYSLALVSDLLALVGDSVSSLGLQFAAPEVDLPLGEGIVARIKRVSPAF
jgi:hypothetical protein